MKIALTGAAGRIGRVLREALLAAGFELHSTDRTEAAWPPHPREQFLLGDLRESAFVDRVLHGVDAVVHLAATSNEQAFGQILDNNHRALFELYEGARRQRLRRVVYASSNHAFGLHPVGLRLRLDAGYRPDCFYGLSKVWGEALGRCTGRSTESRALPAHRQHLRSPAAQCARTEHMARQR